VFLVGLALLRLELQQTQPQQRQLKGFVGYGSGFSLWLLCHNSRNHLYRKPNHRNFYNGLHFGP
jgi:hypothetical protein